jgi:hypothetical protein
MASEQGVLSKIYETVVIVLFYFIFLNIMLKYGYRSCMNKYFGYNLTGLYCHHVCNC